MHYHKLLGQRAGLSAEQIEALEQGDEGPFDELERLVIRFADQVTRTTRPEPEVVQALCQRLSAPQMVVLAATVGLANFTNRFNHALDVQLP